MFCKQCGCEIQDTASFCGNCGSKISQKQTNSSLVVYSISSILNVISLIAWLVIPQFEDRLMHGREKWNWVHISKLSVISALSESSLKAKSIIVIILLATIVSVIISCILNIKKENLKISMICNYAPLVGCILTDIIIVVCNDMLISRIDGWYHIWKLNSLAIVVLVVSIISPIVSNILSKNRT